MPVTSNSAYPPDNRLDSWKEIASYLKRGIRTVQRWESTEGLPVRRLGQDRNGSVFAYKAELDSWLEAHSGSLDPKLESPHTEKLPSVSPQWRIPTIVVLTVLALGIIISRILPSKPVPYRLVPVTTEYGWETQPSFSPDGRQIAYVWVPRGGQPFIYLKMIGADSRIRLTSSAQPERSPAWSPDGHFIAFLSSLRPKQGFALKLVPSSGGPETQIAELATGSSLSWSADGQWLIATDGSSKTRSLVAIEVATGTKHTLTEPYEFGFNGAGLSPDLRRLIFSRSGPGPSAVYELRLRPGLIPEGEPRQVTSPIWARELLVTPDAREIIYTDAVWEEGVGLWRLGLAPGARPQLIHQGSDRYSAPAITRDNHRIVFAVSRVYNEDIWKKSLSDAAAEATPLISSTHSDLNPQYSPDGRYIAFHSTRSGASDIWVAYSDGTNLRRLTFTDARTTATPRWSPDGQWIAFESNQSGQSEVYVVRSVGGPTRRLTDNPASDAIPSWSHDGRTLYFCSNRTGRYEIWKVPAAGGQPYQVTYSGGFAAVESADGKFLYYSQTRNYGPILRVSPAGGKAEQIIPEVRGLFYALTQHGIYFQVNRAICYWDMNSGLIRDVFVPLKPMGIGLAVSPDAQSLLFTQIEAGGSDLYMIDGLRF